MDSVLKSQIQQNVQRYFLEFLERFQEPDGKGGFLPSYYYLDQARDLVQEKRNTLFVKMSHLKSINRETVSFDPDDLCTIIEVKYMMVRDSLNAAVPQLLSKLEGKDIQEEVRQAREKDELKFTAAFFDMEMFSGIRDMRTEKLGQLVTICGTITRITDMKPELLSGTFECLMCKRLITGIEQQFKRTQPTICPNRTCGNKTSWQLRTDLRTTRFSDWQRIRLQENENEIPAGSMPRSIDVIVRDELCERGKAGDKVLVTGSLIVVPDVPSMMSPSELKSQTRRSLNTRQDSAYGSDGIRGLKGLGQRDLTYKLVFFATSVDEHAGWSSRAGEVGENIRSEGKMYLQPSEKEKFEAISEHVAPGGRRDGFDILAKSVAPAVHGHLEVKKGILLMLVGGVPKKTSEGIRLRGDINVCVVGDPATAKSAMLKWTSQFLPRAVFTSGKTSTAAGLTAGVVKDADLDDEKMIEPGALMLADNGVCCIDEFELMDDKDQVAIHEAMEQQTITLCKAGIKATLNARASILASVLPKNTYYQPTQPLHKNIHMSAPIMSRFDMMFVVQDVHDLSTDQFVAQHIVGLHRPGRAQDEESMIRLSQTELQKYIRVARTMRPKISPEARDQLCKAYRKLREENHTRGGCGVTVRQLESLLRLAEAIARVYFSEKVTKDHVMEAFDLQQNSLKKLERENIDLNPDVPADIPQPAEEAQPDAAADAGGQAAARARQQKKVKITYAEYERVGSMLASHLARQEQLGVPVSEEELMIWYCEQVAPECGTEAQLVDEQHKVGLAINRLIDKDRVIVVYKPSDEPIEHPERRILMKHPSYVVGSGIR